MKGQIFCNNVKKAIKKRGYKLETFSRLYLSMSYQTFNHQLKNSNLKIDTIIKLLQILEIDFNSLVLGIAPKIERSVNAVQSVNANTVKEGPTAKTKQGSKKPVTKKPIKLNHYRGLEGLV